MSQENVSVSSANSTRSVSSIILEDAKVKIKSPKHETQLGGIVEKILGHPLSKELSEVNLFKIAYEGVKILKEENIEGLASEDNKNVVLACLSQIISDSTLSPTMKLLLSQIVSNTLPHAIDIIVDALDTTITKVRVFCCRSRKSSV